MNSWSKWAGGIAAATLVCPGPALAAKKGIGPLYNTKYESYGSSERYRSDDGAVVVLEETIETINCGGCDTVWYGPGVLFHLRNLGKTPICAQLDFDRVSKDDYEVDEFGSGSVHYIKAGQTAAQVGGIYVVSSGGTDSHNVGWGGELHTWAPQGKNVCGEAH